MQAQELMTPTPVAVTPVDTVSHAAEVLEKMDRAQVRRIPVVNDGNVLVGIIAQADLAMKLGSQAPLQVESMLERVSAPVIQLA
jgi:CBS domain-containing protein